jgi:hypothetical protein
MYKFLDCDKDTFITNKVVNNSFRVTDANVGRAGEISLFKLYDESVMASTSSGIHERSRVLLKFDFDPIRELTGSGGLLSGTKLSDVNFYLKMFNLYHNDIVPSSFNVVLYPLSKSWSEGPGIDSEEYRDLGVTNWVTASGFSDGWNGEGASSGGYLGQESIDFLTASSVLGDLFVVHNFDDGTEDLSMNITTICSATVAGQIPDHGFVIAFSGSEETDNYSRWIKKFYSRHSRYKQYCPRIEAYWDDSLRNNRSNFYFDNTGSLFFYNIVRGQLTSISSASQNQDTLSVEIKAKTSSVGSTSIYESTVFAKEVYTGIYSCSFAIDSFQTEITGQIDLNSSASFYDYWKDLSGNKAYMTGTFDIAEPDRSTYVKQKRYVFNISNLKSVYYSDEDRARFRVFANEVSFSTDSSKLPSDSQSLLLDKAYYQIRHLNSNDILVAYETTDDSTRLSYDSNGMYFDLDMSVCKPVGELFKIEFMVNDNGIEHYTDDYFVVKVIS